MAYTHRIHAMSLSFAGHVRGGCSPAVRDHLNAQLPRHRCAHDDIFQVSRGLRVHAGSC